MRTITDLLLTHYLPIALNRYLALDPESSQRLNILKNKIVEIKLTVGETSLYKESISNFQLFFSETGIQLKTKNFSKPDTLIQGTPLSLLRMALTHRDRKKFFSEDVSIEGNIELGQQVIALFDALEIDWEEYLSRWVGDIPAHQLTRFTNKINLLSKRFKSALMENINEYVHEEVDLFPSPEALRDFYHEVDTLRMDADRLEARILQLTKNIDAGNKHS